MAFSQHKILIFLFGLYCCCAESEKKVFRKDYTHLEELGAFYKEHKLKQIWNNAVAICREEGAKMFIPRSKHELDIITRTFNSSDKYWLAYQDILSEGHFSAIDGRPDEEVYVNWAENEPRTENESQHCVQYGPVKKTYIVDSCKAKFSFICKKNASTIERNEYCDNYDRNYRFTPVTNRCYKFHTYPAKWNEAFRICKNEGSNLAIVNSDQEADLFVSLFEKHPIDSLKGNFNKHIIHLGFADLLSAGTFKTINDKTLEEAGYDNWSTGYEGSSQQPDNADDNEHCGSMFRDGTLNDINCDTRAMFICERNLPDSVLKSIPSKFSNPTIIFTKFKLMDVY